MLLNDQDILAEVTEGWVALGPWDPAVLQPSSIDMYLGRFFRMFENHRYPHIDPTEEQPELTRLIEVGDEETFVLYPGEFVLGSTQEQVSLPMTVTARLENELSLGRLGLLIHSIVGFINPGFSGRMTLELSNMATLSVKLRSDMKIGQLCFFWLSSEVRHLYSSKGYGSRYQNQWGPTPSRFHLNFHRTKV